MKIKEKVVLAVSENDVIQLINKTYEVDCDSIVAMEEIGNQYLMVNSVDGYQSAYDLSKIEEFKKLGFKHYMINILMNDLCLKGLIPKGDYQIDCTW